MCSANMQHIYRRRPIRKCDFKLLCSTSAWVFYCKLLRICRTPFKKNTSGGLLMCFLPFVLMQSINMTFCWIAFIIYRSEFVDWSKTFGRFSLFYGIVLEIISQLLGVIEASTYYIFISIFNQANVLYNCRSNPPQLLLKKYHLICTCYKCEKE